MKKIEVDHAVGVIVYHDFDGVLNFLILKHKKGHWSYAKGHSNPGETEYMTARRELHEEAGIDDVEFLTDDVVLREQYSFTSKKGVTVMKDVDYFIAKSNTVSITVDNNEITDYKWCTLQEAEELLTYKESFITLKQADTMIRSIKHSATNNE